MVLCIMHNVKRFDLWNVFISIHTKIEGFREHFLKSVPEIVSSIFTWHNTPLGYISTL